ncbi:MAG TPA: hypothetical protein VF170_04400 [Planctomycetaceae bacterium]
MGQPRWDEAEAGVEMCRSCGALYHVTLRRNPTRARDWYNCAVCGRLLMEWDSTESPCFTLVGPGPGYPPKKPR